MTNIKTGYGDSHPPEPEEVPEAIVEIKYDNVTMKNSYTAEELNNALYNIQEEQYYFDLEGIIYLNGVEWDGKSFENKDMTL